MPRRDVSRRRDDAGGSELADLDIRIVGTAARAAEAAAVMRAAGVPVRGPYPRRDEPGRVSYYARLDAGQLPGRPALPGNLPEEPR